MSESAIRKFTREDGETIAYLQRGGKQPGVIWLGGFHSDMMGTKAEALDRWAAARGRAYLRFDYLGHGQSSGQFRNGTISRWRDDALAMLDRLTEGPQLLVGSSMGAWIALLLARLRPEKIAAMLLLAPAADFTESLVWPRLPAEARLAILEGGEWQRPSAYDDGSYPMTRELFEDGKRNRVLDRPIAFTRPVHILQGMQDPDVPWQHAMKVLALLSGNPAITLIRQGDHRLSTPADLRRIETALDALLGEIAA